MDKQYIALLKRKQTILNNILCYTKDKQFEKSEDEVERIEYYLDNRQAMYDELATIQKDLQNIKLNDINNKEVEDIITNNDKIIQEIIKLDEEKKAVMEDILKSLKQDIKSVKSTARFNKSYLGTYENTVGGSLFDSSM